MVSRSNAIQQFPLPFDEDLKIHANCVDAIAAQIRRYFSIG